MNDLEDLKNLEDLKDLEELNNLEQLKDLEDLGKFARIPHHPAPAVVGAAPDKLVT